MALIRSITLDKNQASTSLTLVETTGVYNATTKPGGYGAPNPAIVDNFATIYDFTLTDGSIVTIYTDAATLPTTDFVPKNALTRDFTLAQLGLTGEFAAGVIPVNSKAYFTTPSGGTLTFTQGTNVVVRGGVQDLTLDYAGTSMVLFNGIEYTIVPGSLVTGQFLISAVYTPATLTAVGYRGYAATAAAVIDKPFKDCLMPRYIANRAGTCDKSLYSTIIKLRYQWDAVYALALVDPTAANLFMQDITRDCTCLSSTSTLSGCSTCL